MIAGFAIVAAALLAAIGTVSWGGDVSPSSPHRFTVGERFTYFLRYESTSRSDIRPLFEGGGAKRSGKMEMSGNLTPTTYKTAVRGKLSVTRLDLREDGVFVLYRFQDPAVTFAVNDVGSPEQAQGLKKELREGIFALVGFDGRIASLWFEPSVSNLARSYARTILALTQVTFPGPTVPESGQWESNEDDPNGRYVARYVKRTPQGKKTASAPPGSVGTFRKSKLRYLPEPRKKRSGSIDLSSAILTKGHLTVRFDFDAGCVASVGGSETQDTSINGKAIGSARYSLDLSLAKKDLPTRETLSSMREAGAGRSSRVAAVPLSVKPPEEEFETSIQRNELGDATAESLMADLRTAETSGDPGFRETPLYLKFKALVYLHPEACEALGVSLDNAVAGSLRLRILAGALGAVAHPSAQKALIRAIKVHSGDLPVLMNLLPTLGSVPEPIPEAEEVLRKLAFGSEDPGIASTAQLALGVIARNLSRSDPGKASGIVDSFVKAIGASSSTEETHRYLLALGNTGNAAALPAIRRFVDDRDPGLRAAAVSALRHIGSDEAEGLLVRALSTDADDPVRRQAATAMRYRKMTAAAYQAQKAAFTGDRDAKVRLLVLENLWKAREAYPEVVELVRKAANKDPSEDVRKEAKELTDR